VIRLSSGPDAPAGDAATEPVAEGDGLSDEAKEAAPPRDDDREDMVVALRDTLGDAVIDQHVAPGDDIWVRVELGSWRAAAEAARDQLGCTYFCFLSAVDWLPSPFGRDMDAIEDKGGDGGPVVIDTSKPEGGWETGLAGGETRFQLLARLEKPGEDRGITLKADLPDDDLRADTWSDLFAGADWHEREAHEMFGIDFTGHPNLAHIYLPGEFEGNPLRKDFPLLARRVKPWPGIVDVEPMPGEEEAPVDPEAAAGDAVESTGEVEGDAEVQQP
jgi:NADH-quinone oxidoreductase subunit C